jgi:hypothetical protein
MAGAPGPDRPNIHNQRLPMAGPRGHADVLMRAKGPELSANIRPGTDAGNTA